MGKPARPCILGLVKARGASCIWSDTEAKRNEDQPQKTGRPKGLQQKLPSASLRLLAVSI